MYSAIIIGCGFSGICMAIKLKEKGIHNFIILEKANDIGGTWRENTYPGAECDIPSALYSYSFEPYTHWEYKWSHQSQILDYLKYCVDKYELKGHIRYGSELLEAAWNDDENSWNVATKNGSCYQGKTLITAIGQLHHPSIPKLEGEEHYKGVAFHSAQWNHDINLAGKKVGVIGNAASAVQFIPSIRRKAQRIIIFQRSANWMLPKQDRIYKEWEKKLVKRIPFLLKLYRLRLWLLGGGLFFLMKKENNFFRRFYEAKTVSYIKKHIKDPSLIKNLIPNYPMGAKRILISDDYYEALGKENVHVEVEPIKKFTEQGILLTNGTQYNLDVLIYATGFKTNPFFSAIHIYGKKGLSIKKAWEKGPKNYLGISVNEFPNMFMMYGPNTNLGHNSIIIMSESQADYILQCIHAMIKNEWYSVEVKKSVLEKYYQSIQKRLNNMIWSQVDHSWYKSKTGNIPNNWPGRTLEYMNKTKKVNFNDYVIVKPSRHL